MDTDIIAAVNGMQIYQSDIDLYTAEYIDSLPNPDNIYKSATFTGLIEFISRKVIKPLNITDSTGKTLNYKALNDIFYNIYIPICTRFNICPTVIGFSTLAKIDRANLTDIKNGIYRSDGRKASPEATQIVKKWFETCENGLTGKAINENGIGSIFLLKSKYGYQEQNTLTIQTDTINHDTAEQIASRHNAALIPEKPEISTD